MYTRTARLSQGMLLWVIMLLVACGNTNTSTPDPGVSADSTVRAARAAAPSQIPQATVTPEASAAPATVVATIDTPQLPAIVTDGTGNEITVESVERIITLNGDITEIVVALGLGDHLVGVDLSATYPPEVVETLPKVGYQFNLNAEGILSLNPTVVIGKEGVGPPEVLEQVRSASIPIVIGPDNQGIDAPAEKIRFVAAALGIPKAGEALVADLEADLEAARDLLAQVESPTPRVLFLYLRGTSTQAVAGSDTAADTMITAAGGMNVAAAQGIEGYEPLSPEVVAMAQPEVILLMESGLQSMGGPDGLFAIPGLADTPAAQEQRVVTMDGLYLIGLGPRTGAAILDLLLQLHPELAPGSTE